MYFKIRCRIFKVFIMKKSSLKEILSRCQDKVLKRISFHKFGWFIMKINKIERSKYHLETLRSKKFKFGRPKYEEK